MKLVVIAIFAALVILVHAEEEWAGIDWANVLPVQDMPGFWDGRKIKPAIYPGDQTRTGRIVGGQPVVRFSHPYQVGLIMNFNGPTGLCGGSLLDTYRVLTAAHCPEGSAFITAIFGAFELTSDREASQRRRTITPGGYYIHPQYDSSTLQNDVAVLILPLAIQFSPQIQPIALAPTSSDTFAGEFATVTGWGRTSDTSINSRDLRGVQNIVITNSACRAVYGDIIVDSTLCMATTGGRGTCIG
jgi:secreted trypsin-like serine protease